MKYFYLLLIALCLISCSGEPKSEYNPRAIELNEKALNLSLNCKYDSALLLYDKAIEIDERYHVPHSNKVQIYLHQKEYDKALYESEIVIKKKPDLAEAWFFAGLLNEQQANRKKAMSYYRKSIAIYTARINNPEKKKYINANKLNRALAKKFVNDQSYVKDFEELRDYENYSMLIDQFKDKSKAEIIKEFTK